jgi:Sugar transferases involved in lipopolysaccharide synthesis
MVPDAEEKLEELADLNEMDGAGFKIANDPRLIKGGAFLRRYSLDELPQFWNVLRGTMSLVGPRPLSIRDYNLLPEDWQFRRFSMKPGLTCVWQVSGRNSLLFDDWMKMDLDYIDRWTIWLDIRILLKTFVEVFRGGGK